VKRFLHLTAAETLTPPPLSRARSPPAPPEEKKPDADSGTSGGPVDPGATGEDGVPPAGPAPVASRAGGGGDGGGHPEQNDAQPGRLTSGSMTVAVPRSMTGSLPSFLRLLASHADATYSDAGTLVKEWGISNSTLEVRHCAEGCAGGGGSPLHLVAWVAPLVCVLNWNTT
jgi:hypothetical protein